MRFSLFDLLVAIAVFSLGVLIVVAAAHWAGIAKPSIVVVELLGIPFGAVLYLFITPPIYRRFRLRPLLLPKCPHCQKHDGYHVEKQQWPKVAGSCLHCSQPVELLWRQPVPEDVSKTTPSLHLVWPESIGRWLLISKP